jgi:predicted phage terminase large subunit-like protein
MVVPQVELVKNHSKQLEDYLKEVDYRAFEENYIPSDFALEFIAFIKMVNGPEGEENESPLIHMDMLDQLLEDRDNLFVSFRGSAKTSVLHEYLFLYLACYGKFPGFGDVNVAIYVSDTIDNGVKSMRQQLQFRWEKSDFLRHYVPEVKFTDVRWEFTNIEGKKLCIRGFGAATGVRGFKEYGQRPTWCGLDDLLSDKNAESPTIIKDIRNVVYKAVRNALHPKKRMTVWTGTPFNKKDPLYNAAGSEGWNTRVYPICEQFPCTKEEFVGAWEDRFPYEFVKKEYDKLLADGEISSFNQELMLKIVSEEDRLVQDADILWYNRESVMRNRGAFNFYITTDFATSEEQASDYSVIMVWAYNAQGDWFLVDIMVERQLMDKNVDELFRLVQIYKPQQVGVEVSGQQKGFVAWLKREMITRNIWFVFASSNNDNKEGIRPVTKKIQRFNIVVPWFKSKKMYFPAELKDTKEMKEVMEEITLATMEGFKSKRDDCADCTSQLADLTPWKPSPEVQMKQKDNEDPWEVDEEEDASSGIQSYIV